MTYLEHTDRRTELFMRQQDTEQFARHIDKRQCRHMTDGRRCVLVVGHLGDVHPTEDVEEL